MKYILLRENIQKARKVLKSVNVSEDNPKFQKIKDLLGKHTGYLGLFTYLHFKGKVLLPRLQNLLDSLIQNKHLLKNLPKQVVNYKNIEELEDDLTNAIHWSDYNKEFVSKLKGELKSSARKDNELKDLYTHLSDETKQSLFHNFIPKISRYKSYDDFKKDVIHFTKRDGSDINELLKKLKETEDVYVIYNKDNIVIAAVFSKKASCEIGSKSWCISGDKGSFWESYAGISTKNKQYFIWNFNVSPANMESQVGVTVRRNGSIKTAHLKNDVYVNIQDYTDSYDIPMEVLKPLNVEKDIDKIIKANGFTKDVVLLINDSDLIEKYKDHIPSKYKFMLGILEERDLVKLNEIRKSIYSSNGDDSLIRSMFEFIDSNYKYSDGVEKFLEDNKSKRPIEILNSLSFVDKIFIINKFNFIDLENGISDIFFNKEIVLMDEMGYPLKIEIDNLWRSDEVNFKFTISEGDYATEIMDVYEEFYWDLNRLSDSYGILDDIDSDEFNYLPNYFDEKSMEKISQYLNTFLYPNVHHPKVKEYVKGLSTYLTNLSENIHNNSDDDYSDSFNTAFNIISEIDPLFNDPYNHNSYFSDFWDEIISSAQNIVNDDSNEYNDHKLGEYDSYDNRGQWKVSKEDIYDSLIKIENIFELIDEYSIKDWINSSPGSLEDANFSFYDSPYYSHYLSMADTTEANKDLQEAFDSVLNGTHYKFDEENLEWFGKVDRILSNIWEPISEESQFSNRSDFFGYKKTTGEYLNIIPYTSINYDGTATIYSIKTSDLNDLIEKNKVNHWSGFSYDKLTRYNDIDLKNNGFVKKEVDIIDMYRDSDQEYDPNQLEFKFENLKKFNQFIKTTKG